MFLCQPVGAIRENLDTVRVNLKDREERRHRLDNWYQSIFLWSSWLTALLSSSGLLTLILIRLLVVWWDSESSTALPIVQKENKLS